MLLAITGLAVSFLTFVVATIGLIKGFAHFNTWYYCWAWWSVVVFVQSWTKLKKDYSLLYNKFYDFLFLSFLSVPFWLFFELINIKLHNWYYVNLPSNLFVRWLGYFIAYATVLPAIFTVKGLLDCYNRSWKLPHLFRDFLLTLSHCPRSFLMVGGLFLFVLTITFPKFCFPFAWIFLMFLLDPINEHLNLPSFLRQWNNESFSDTEKFLLSGLICGVLWESLNFWAGSKWRYSLPFFNHPKIFEMPVLGYLGFLPFAIECAVFSYLIFLLKPRILKTRLLVVIAVYILLSFVCIDMFTVHSFK